MGTYEKRKPCYNNGLVIMAYANKIEDHQKRRDQEGSYSLYNHLYNYLLNNYEPENLESSIACESAERDLISVGREYQLNGKGKYNDDEIKHNARQAISNFVNNDGEHGDTANNFGKEHENSFDTVKESLFDLKW